MTVQIIPIPALQDNYIWILIDEKRQVWVVDPGEAAPVLDYLKAERCTLKGILITHHHADHTGGVKALLQYQAVPVFGSYLSKIESVTQPLRELDQIQLSESWPKFQILEIPGHTLDHLAFIAPGMLFCGDTLFAAGCGRVFEGTASQMYTSLQKLAVLPDSIQVYCAHEYTLANLRFAMQVEPQNPRLAERMQRVQVLRDQDLPSLPSLLKEEKETNPFLRCEEAAVIASASEKAGKRLQDPVEVFTALRTWKSKF